MSVALAMFRKSNKDGDIKKAAQKVADPKKDTLTRLKHLRTVLGEIFQHPPIERLYACIPVSWEARIRAILTGFLTASR